MLTIELPRKLSTSKRALIRCLKLPRLSDQQRREVLRDHRLLKRAKRQAKRYRKRPQFRQPHRRDMVFLGRYQAHRRGKTYDLWWVACVIEPTLIARWSSHGPDYMSGLPFGWTPDQPDHPLVVARIRAQRRGLDVRASYYNGPGKLRRHRSGVLVPASMENWYDSFWKEAGEKVRREIDAERKVQGILHEQPA